MKPELFSGFKNAFEETDRIVRRVSDLGLEVRFVGMRSLGLEWSEPIRYTPIVIGNEPGSKSTFGGFIGKLYTTSESSDCIGVADTARMNFVEHNKRGDITYTSSYDRSNGVYTGRWKWKFEHEATKTFSIGRI